MSDDSALTKAATPLMNRLRRASMSDAASNSVIPLSGPLSRIPSMEPQGYKATGGILVPSRPSSGASGILNPFIKTPFGLAPLAAPASSSPLPRTLSLASVNSITGEARSIAQSIAITAASRKARAARLSSVNLTADAMAEILKSHAKHSPRGSTTGTTGGHGSASHAASWSTLKSARSALVESEINPLLFAGNDVAKKIELETRRLEALTKKAEDMKRQLELRRNTGSGASTSTMSEREAKTMLHHRQAEIDRVMTKNNALEMRHRKVRDDINLLRREHVVVKRQIKEAQARCVTMETELSNTTKALSDVELERRMLEDEIAAARSDIEGEKKQFEKTFKALGEQLESTRLAEMRDKTKEMHAKVKVAKETDEEETLGLLTKEEEKLAVSHIAKTKWRMAKNMVKLRIGQDQQERYESMISKLLEETACESVQDFVKKYQLQDSLNFSLMQQRSRHFEEFRAQQASNEAVASELSAYMNVSSAKFSDSPSDARLEELNIRLAEADEAYARAEDALAVLLDANEVIKPPVQHLFEVMNSEVLRSADTISVPGMAVNSQTMMTCLGVIESRVLLLLQISAELLKREQEAGGASGESSMLLANSLMLPLPEHEHRSTPIAVVPPASEDFRDPVFESGRGHGDVFDEMEMDEDRPVDFTVLREATKAHFEANPPTGAKSQAVYMPRHAASKHVAPAGAAGGGKVKDGKVPGQAASKDTAALGALSPSEASTSPRVARGSVVTRLTNVPVLNKGLSKGASGATLMAVAASAAAVSPLLKKKGPRGMGAEGPKTSM